MQGNDPYNRCKSHRADNSEHINFYDRCLGEFVPEKKSIIFYRNYFVPGQTSYAIGLEKISKYWSFRFIKCVSIRMEKIFLHSLTESKADTDGEKVIRTVANLDI